MSKFNLEIVTPTQILESVNVSYARCPGVDGLFGIMSGHREAIIALDLGEIKITSDNKDAYYSTSGGFVEITKDKINLLVETIEKSTDIDKDRAEASLKRAQDR
jgi:ATP synthase, F1 epsilon subunit (delta in mitochondria)